MREKSNYIKLLIHSLVFSLVSIYILPSLPNIHTLSAFTSMSNDLYLIRKTMVYGIIQIYVQQNQLTFFWYNFHTCHTNIMIFIPVKVAPYKHPFVLSKSQTEVMFYTIIHAGSRIQKLIKPSHYMLPKMYRYQTLNMYI
jgi:hypothetical protein